MKTLKTKTIERYLPILEKEGFEIKSKGEPYLIKKSLRFDELSHKNDYITFLKPKLHARYIIFPTNINDNKYLFPATI